MNMGICTVDGAGIEGSKMHLHKDMTPSTKIVSEFMRAVKHTSDLPPSIVHKFASQAPQKLNG